MGKGMDNSLPSVIAVDYYDGAISGVAAGFQEMEAFYFHLVAWDEAQDERLFVVVGIEGWQFAELAEVMSAGVNLAGRRVLIPDVTLLADCAQLRINETIEGFKLRAVEGKRLLLTDDTELRSGAIFEMPEALATQVVSVIATGRKESLAWWKAQL
ncbi:hypothetical protein [Stenotrophomonas sp.]|uniref:hypothetical protein n=1 Tax=Stenotrophomonas sp. TaxID=69392 RepID=UPI0028992363|nr:hypothetical protein [Stenotrophomonas sp.]